MELQGKPYYMGGRAYHPRTRKQCKVNFYGGFVCSRECDFRSSLRLESTMPGHSVDQRSLGVYAKQHFNSNWSDDHG